MKWLHYRLRFECVALFGQHNFCLLLHGAVGSRKFMIVCNPCKLILSLTFVTKFSTNCLVAASEGRMGSTSPLRINDSPNSIDALLGEYFLYERPCLVDDQVLPHHIFETSEFEFERAIQHIDHRCLYLK